jgi:hypothetical protein
VGSKAKIKKAKGKKKKLGSKKRKQERLSKVKGTTPDPKRRESKLRG